MKRKPPQPESPDTADDGPKIIGYARVSTEDQNLDMQVQALKAAGAWVIYTEKKSAGGTRRVELDRLMRDLRPGDTMLVWRIDRLARSNRELYKRLDEIYEAKATFRSLSESWDFSTAMGKMLLGMAALFAEFERQLTIERTRAGMAAAKLRGSQVGQPMKFTPKLQARAKGLMKMRERGKDGKWRNKFTLAEIGKQLDISVSSIQGRLKGGRRKHGKR